MAKILTDEEMGQIVFDATHKRSEIDCSTAYEHFLADLGALIVSHFGGRQGQICSPDGDGLGWTCGFHINDCVPSDGGVYRSYDQDVIWLNGREAQQ